MTHGIDEGYFLLLVTYDNDEWEEIDRSDMFEVLERQTRDISKDVSMYVIVRVEELGTPLSDENTIEY